MRLIIAGSRSVRPTVAEIDATFDDLLFVVGDVVEVISGDASGADQAGEVWAISKGIAVHHEPITPDDMKLGKYLGPRQRNRRMAERGDAALIFWDGISGGSADMCIRMVARGKPVRVIPTRKHKRG